MMLPNGTTRIEAGGRTYIGNTIAGTAAIQIYDQVWGMISANDNRILAALAVGGDEGKVQFGMMLATAPGFPELRARILQGYTITAPGEPQLHLPADWDVAFRGRPSEATFVAVGVLSVEGFFVVPGTLRRSGGTKPAPDAAPAQDPGVV